MFRDYDSYGRRNGRSPYITNIPGQARQQTPDPASEIMRLRQQLEQAQAKAAEWEQAARQYHALAKQQQAEVNGAAKKLAHLEQKLAAAQKETTRQAVEIAKKQAKPVNAPQTANTTDQTNEWQEKYLRLYADFENGKKRLEQRYALESQQNQEKLLRDMLPLADNLERAMQHESTDQAGLAMIYKGFLAALAKYGVEPMVAAERPFNPELHEAVNVISHPTTPSGTVASVLENGYTYQGNLLRPAKVLVAQ
jgi:molecular chaperone GrpE